MNQTRYDNLNLSFLMENYRVSVVNVVFEQFQRAIPMHSHGEDCYEIHFIPYGRGSAEVNGREYPLLENTLFVTGPFVEHAQWPDSESPMAEYCVYFRFRRLGVSRGSYKNAASSALSHFLARPFFLAPDRPEMHFLMQQLFQELSERKIGFTENAEALLRQIIVSIARAERSDEPHSEIQQREPGVFSDRNSLIIEESFLYEYDTITLERLSRRLSLSPRQTERLMQQYYGSSFKIQRSRARMHAAENLLLRSDESVSRIAELTGYTSAEHFSSAFRKSHGLSPSAYRKSRGEKDTKT